MSTDLWRACPRRRWVSLRIRLSAPGSYSLIEYVPWLVFRYAHCDELEKSVGQTVRRGDRVATIGSTGRSSGPHLHFEVRLEGYSKDPYDYIEL